MGNLYPLNQSRYPNKFYVDVIRKAKTNTTDKNTVKVTEPSVVNNY